MRQLIFFILVMLWTVCIVNSATSQNPIQVENARLGTTEWQIAVKDASSHHEVEGFASLTSVNVGDLIRFYVNVDFAQTVHIDIYRLGYYNGAGGRYIQGLHSAWVTPKPIPSPDHIYGMAECEWPAGVNQQTHQQWSVPPDAVSGVYLAKLTGQGNGLSSYISFVVRDDSRTSDILFQRSVTTDQAYNNYPGNLYPLGVDEDGHPIDTTYSNWGNGKSLYQTASFGPNLPGPSEKRQARKVSFNRPYWLTTSAYGIYDTAGATLFNYDYNLIRWLEKNGYDATFSTDIDLHTSDSANGRLSAGRHKVLVSGGHDEYWSWEMRDKTEDALSRSSQPMNLAFIGGNAVYWQIRMESSSSTGTVPASASNRTIIAYKETAKNVSPFENDPLFQNGDTNDNHLITNKWRENQLNGGSLSKPPEDGLIGVMYSDVPQFCCTSNAAVLSTNCPPWVCSNLNGETLDGLVGYEADRLHMENTYTGRSLSVIGDSPYRNKFLTVLGNSNMTYYVRNSNNARVFAFGTNQWAWGLDNYNADPNVGPVIRGQYKKTDAELITSRMFGCLISGNCS